MQPQTGLGQRVAARLQREQSGQPPASIHAVTDAHDSPESGPRARDRASPIPSPTPSTGLDPSRDLDSSGRQPIWANPWLWAILAGLILIPAMRPFLRFEPAPPPILIQLPEFSLQDQNGRVFGSDQLAGKVYVASFLFTRCTTICPAITSAVRRLGERFREEQVEGVELVSFTVDPTYDTPEVLSEFAQRHRINGERWRLLTGDEDQIRSLVVDGFKTPMGSLEQATGSDDPAQTLIDIAHTGRLVLVDGSGGIRGYYDISVEGLDEVFHRTRHVLSERRPRRRSAGDRGS